MPHMNDRKGQIDEHHLAREQPFLLQLDQTPGSATSSGPPNVLRMAAGLTGVGVVVFIVATIVAHLARTDLNPLVEPVSLYCLGDTGWIMTVAKVAVGLAGLSVLASSRGLSIAGRVSLALWAAMSLAATAFPMDAPGARRGPRPASSTNGLVSTSCSRSQRLCSSRGRSSAVTTAFGGGGHARARRPDRQRHLARPLYGRLAQPRPWQAAARRLVDVAHLARHAADGGSCRPHRRRP